MKSGKILLVVLILLIGMACSNSSDKEKFDKAQQLVMQDKIDEAIKEYSILIKEYPRSNFTPTAIFEIAKLYQQKAGLSSEKNSNIEKAASNYLEVFKNYERSKEAPQALFMTAFLYANELEKMDSAKILYNQFLKKYPDNEMAVSARAELDNLGLSPEEILMKKTSPENIEQK